MSRYVIACGGTGGHLTPGIALAEALIKQGHECLLLISRKKVDMRLSAKYSHLRFVEVPGAPFMLNPIQMVRCVVSMIQGIFFHWRLIRGMKPDMVVGFGGFMTVAISIVACLLGCPFVLHEANRCAGKAIRLMSFFAARVYLPEGVDLNSLPPKTIRHYGYPVRPDVYKIPRVMARMHLGLPDYGRVLLIFGGSQGARRLNKWAEKHFIALAQQGIHVYCITGMGSQPQNLVYRHSNGQSYKAIFKQFVDEIHVVMSACDLAVSRAGAGSIAECVRCQIPGIFVPYPYSADDHQKANAQYIERQGCGVMLEDREMDRYLMREIQDIFADDHLLEHFRKNLLRLDRVDYAQVLANDLEQLLIHLREI